jgi:putative chitinase
LPETLVAVADAIAAAGGNALAVSTFTGPLGVACKRFDILTRLRLAHFVAQLGHESWNFTKLEENLNYSVERLRQVFKDRFGTNAMAEPYARNPAALANLVYAGVGGNGPPASGDGWRYRGRGLIQLTGLNNYRAAGASLGLPFLSDPDEASKPWNAALIAGWYWSSRNLNRHADADDLESISDLINRGRVTPAKGDAIGFADRAAKYERAMAALAAHPERLEPAA